MKIRHTHLSFVLLILLISLVSCTHTKSIYLQKVEGYQTKIDTLLSKNTKVEDIIAPYRESLTQEMNEVIGVLDNEMTKAQPESTLGNFNADAILFAARKNAKDTIHAAITNYGGIRIPFVPKGAIKLGTIYELMPFENMLVVLEMTGQELKQYLQHTVQSGGWPISKEINIVSDTINQKNTFKIAGQPIIDNLNYSICTSDYLANGGDNCDFLKEIKRENLGILFREGLIQYVVSHTKMDKSIKSVKENRFIYVQ